MDYRMEMIDMHYALDKNAYIDNSKQEKPKGVHWNVMDFDNGNAYAMDVVPFIKREIQWRTKDSVDMSTFDKFSKNMFRIVMYLFHGRSQFEQMLTYRFTVVDKEEVIRLAKDMEEHPNQFRYEARLSYGTAMDIATQIASNWDAFIEYMWNHRKELLEDE